jgi:hypothetical protein
MRAVLHQRPFLRRRRVEAESRHVANLALHHRQFLSRGTCQPMRLRP